jgi:hypothetical protein
MSTEWYLMGSKPVYNSGFEKEEFDAYAKDSFNELLETSPISKSVKIVKNDLTVVSEIKAYIQNNTPDSESQSTQRQILTTIGTLRCGDYILFENKIWLVATLVGNNGINEKAIMEFCNYTLMWQNSSGTILSYPCINATTNTIGIDENKIIQTGSAVHTIKLPFDLETKMLDVDQRFFIDDLSVPIPQVFAISKPDRVTIPGIVKLTMKQGVYNPTVDNKTLGICGHVDATPTQPEGSTSASITSNGDLVMNGSKRTITCVLYNADKTINTTVVPIWKVDKPVGFERYVIDEVDVVDKHKYYITVAEDDSYGVVGQIVNISISDGNGEFKGNLSLNIGA